MDANQSVNKNSKPQLSPYQEGVKKALSQAGQQQASEAITQGVPPQYIEQQAGLVDPQLLQQLMQLSNQQVPAQNDGSILGDKIGVLPAILSTLSGKPTSPFQQKTQPLGLDNAIQLAGFQQKASQAPLEMQKLQQEVDPNFQQEQLRQQELIKSEVSEQRELGKEERAQLNEFKINVLRPQKMTGADATKFNIQKQGLQALMTIEQFIDNPEMIEQLNVPGSKVGQQLASAVNIFSNASLRDESGGVITKDEIKQFKNDLSPGTGFRALLNDPSNQKLRLQSFKQRLQGSIKNIDPFAEIRDSYKKAKQAGYRDEEIFAFLRQRGDV